MELNELKTVLSSNLNGTFTDEDIDYFIKDLDEDEKNHEYVRVNGVLIPFRRICIGLQVLSDKLEDTELLFIYNYRQCQIKIYDIQSIEFNPEYILH